VTRLYLIGDPAEEPDLGGEGLSQGAQGLQLELRPAVSSARRLGAPSRLFLYLSLPSALVAKASHTRAPTAGVGPARPAAMSHPVPAMTLREVLQQRTPGHARARADGDLHRPR